MASILEQYRIADFLEWHRERRLNLNPEFQRASVWTPAARSFLINTILNELPIPKIYLRTIIDVNTKSSIRDVVDGQQRLRAIIDFANDKLVLTKAASEYQGYTFSSLPQELQEKFLSYALSVDQLLNAGNKEVLEIFSRLNSYSVQLNAQEKRHAKYQSDFKLDVVGISKEFGDFWEKYQILSIRERVRMLDDSLVSEMFGILLEGVQDGGEDKLNKLYERYKSPSAYSADMNDIGKKCADILIYFDKNLGDALTVPNKLYKAPHFLMLFAALAHALYGIGFGGMGEHMPARDPSALTNLAIVRDNLATLEEAIEAKSQDSVIQPLKEFWLKSSSSTQRISSRLVRFPVFYSALLPQRIV